MASDLIPFTFDGCPVRAVSIDGEPWFVAKDVAELLGYANPSRSVENHCKALKKFNTTELVGLGFAAPPLSGLILIPERDLYRPIMQSKLPAAERFEEWVVGEVIPSIRKTGTYRAGFQYGTVAEKEALAFRSYHSIATLIGLDPNQSALAAARAVKVVAGRDPLVLLGATHLVAPQQADHLTPTDLGTRLGGLSAMAVNGLLHDLGFQSSWRDDKRRQHWEPTEQGKPYAVWLDTGKKHSDGSPVRQLRWSAGILSLVRGPEAQQ